MKNNNKKLKAIVLSLGLGAAMLTAPSVKAQGVFGDMLDNYYSEKESSPESMASYMIFLQKLGSLYDYYDIYPDFNIENNHDRHRK